MVEMQTTSEGADNRLDLRAELDRLEEMLADLKVQFEQYFSGALPLAPDKQHTETKRLIRLLTKAPFKNSALNYRLRMLKYRYSCLHTYWQRVLKQREEGTYFKDVFKANLRERMAMEEARALTKAGIAEKNLQALFESYKKACEKFGSDTARLDYEKFQNGLVARADELKRKNPGKKVAFKIVSKDGKVTVQARVKA